MNLKEYQELARRTQNTEITLAEQERHALFGMASEVGEIHAVYQKVFQGHNMDYMKVVDEMGDLMWFLAELADSIGVTLDDVAEHNIAKLKKRYPNGFDVEHSVHREEYA